MASLGDPPYLPEPFEDATILALCDSISFPRPTSIHFMNVVAFYHLLYKLTWPSELIASKLPQRLRQPAGTTTTLILRVAGEHIPRMKTENEAAVISWVRQNTSVPVPEIVHFDSSVNNPLDCEYIIMSVCPGAILGDVFDDLSTDDVTGIFDQVMEILAELHRTSWSHIGGLKFADAQHSTIVPGPLLEETFCHVTADDRYWGPEEHLDKIQLTTGPFANYVDYITAVVRKNMTYIRTHPAVRYLLPLLPRLEIFLARLRERADVLNECKLRLAHKDLHLANIMYDTTTRRITALVDWEFSAVVPFTRWNPVLSFPWNGRKTKKDMAQTRPLYAKFETRCKQRGYDWLLQDAEYTSRDQEEMQKAAELLQTVVAMKIKRHAELLPRIDGWTEDLCESLKYFGA